MARGALDVGLHDRGKEVILRGGRMGADQRDMVGSLLMLHKASLYT
jgi:hypothetical protein